MTGPAIGPLAGADHLRVGDAERDEVAVALHDHFAQGRLTRDELDQRLEVTLSAKTVGDLREVIRDLPGPHTESGAQTGPGPQGGPGGPGGWGGAWAAPGGPHRSRLGARHVHGRHRPGLHLVPLLLGIVLITVIAGGSGSLPLWGIVRGVLLVWLVLAILGHVRHHRRWRRR